MHVHKLDLALFLALALSASGCHNQPKNEPTIDNDRASGPDGNRLGAQHMQLGKLITDEVDFDKGDMSDWRQVHLTQKGTIKVKLHWDSDKMDLNVDVFDPRGDPLASSPGLLPGSQEKSVLAQIDGPGSYFIRVTAPRAKMACVYTLQATWDNTPPPPPTPPAK